MARCEDFPCCGHESGCCPDYDKAGRQLNMICTCGAKLPVTSRYSICQSCLNAGDEDFYDEEYYDASYLDEEDEEINAGTEDYYPEDLGWDGGMEM